MRAIRAIWEFLKTVFRGSWRLLKSIYRKIATLIAGLFGPPTEALKRVFAAIRAQMSRFLDLILTAWSRVFQRAPRAPKDRRTTPGRSILLLVGAEIAAAFWYLAPWRDWFGLSELHFELWFYGTTIAVALVIRAFIRVNTRGPIARFFDHASERVGLIWFERFVFVGSLAALWFVRSNGWFRPLAVVVAVGFFVLLTSPYEPRPLKDDLPEIPELVTEEDGADFASHSFEWDVAWGASVNRFAITVEVDTQRFAQMQTLNPIAPADSGDPDFTPWVVAGSTPEVDRSAAAIRSVSNDLGYTRVQEAAAALAFAQSMDYQFDEDSTAHAEYWRYPIETIHEETGDCEDTTILAAAVLRRLGHGVLPIVMPGHAALGVEAPTDVEGAFVVHEGRRYYYCETTTEGWKIGQLPTGIDPGDIAISPLREPSK